MKERLSRTGIVGMLGLCGGLLISSCGTTVTQSDGRTRIFGEVVDSNSGTPAFGLGLGVRYESIPSTAPHVLIPAQGVNVGIDPPYPNPAAGGDVTFKVAAGEPVMDVRIEIAGVSESSPGTFRVLFDGDLATGTHSTKWDLRDAVGLAVPNGVYFAQVVGPFPGQGETVLAEAVIVVNRSIFDATAIQAFNATTDGSGNYDLNDIVVGESFIKTNEQGEAQGAYELRNRVTVFTDDRGYQPFQQSVDIAPRQSLRLDINLLPRKPTLPL